MKLLNYEESMMDEKKRIQGNNVSNFEMVDLSEDQEVIEAVKMLKKEESSRH